MLLKERISWWTTEATALPVPVNLFSNILTVLLSWLSTKWPEHPAYAVMNHIELYTGRVATCTKLFCVTWLTMVCNGVEWLNSMRLEANVRHLSGDFFSMHLVEKSPSNYFKYLRNLFLGAKVMCHQRVKHRYVHCLNQCLPNLLAYRSVKRPDQVNLDHW